MNCNFFLFLKNDLELIDAISKYKFILVFEVDEKQVLEYLFFVQISPILVKDINFFKVFLYVSIGVACLKIFSYRGHSEMISYIFLVIIDPLPLYTILLIY